MSEKLIVRKLSGLGKGKKRAFTLLTVFLLIASLLPLIAATSESVQAQSENKFIVKWRLVRDGIIHKVWEIEVQNLTANNRDAYLGTFFSDTSFPIDNLRNVEFYEWKALQTEIDVEGSELEVLRGAEKILNSPNVKLAIAAYHTLPDGKPEFPDILSYLKSRGMKIWTKNNIFIYAKT